jgi:IS605 OrfB family transposase
MVWSARNITTRKKTAVEREIEALLGEPLPYEPIKPTHYGKKITLTAQVARIEEGRNSFDLWLILTSVGKNIKLSLPLKRHRHLNTFRDWKQASTIVITSDYVQLSFKMETEPKKEAGQCVGIDVGINHLLATSDRELFGSEVKQLIETIKRKTQGSKAYKRAKKTLSYYLHKVVKDYFASHDLQLVVVEKLQDLKQGKKNRTKAFRKTLSHWNYRELLDIIRMRCEEHRVSFRSVSPYKTSQRCPRCSHTQRENRNGEEFHCLQCGFEEQADIVGSVNILQRFLSGRYGAGFQTE